MKKLGKVLEFPRHADSPLALPNSNQTFQMSRATVMKVVVVIAIIIVVAVGYSMMKGKAATAPVVNPA